MHVDGLNNLISKLVVGVYYLSKKKNLLVYIGEREREREREREARITQIQVD